MTTYNNFSDRNRDIQDGAERHVWGKLEYENGSGAYMTLRGTGTTEYDVGVINVGYGFNLPENFNTEVMVFSDGSDTNQKHGFPTLPRDKQRQWKENTGGIQNPLDSNKVLEFNPDRAFLREANAVIGNGGVFEIVGNTVIIRGNLRVEGSIICGGSVSAKGGIYSEGDGIFNGDLSTSHLRSPHSSDDNATTSVTADIPAFEDNYA